MFYDFSVQIFKKVGFDGRYFRIVVVVGRFVNIKWSPISGPASIFFF